MVPRLNKRASRPRLKIPRSQRSIVPFRITPPPQPPTRNVKLPFRRLVQFDANATSENNRYTVNNLFSEVYNTAGFNSVFIHSVKVWTKPETAGSSSLSLRPVSCSDRPNPMVSFADRSLDLNGRARVGFAFPNEMGGPFAKNEVYCEVSTENSKRVTIELDLTFM